MRTVWKRLMVLALLALAAGGAVALSPPAAEPPLAVQPTSPPSPPPSAEPPARPEAAVALDWSGPPTATANRPAEWTLTVRNLSALPAQKATVQVRAPKDATVRQTAPAAKVVDGVYMWELGTLDARSATHLRLTLTPTARGEMGCQAWVTFTGTSGMTVAVKEPKLEVTLKAADKVALGAPFSLWYSIANVGDAPASEVKWDFPISPGTTVARHSDSPKSVTLAPGEKYEDRVEVFAGSEGDLGLSMTVGDGERLSTSATTTIRVVKPQLTVDLIGPSELLLGRKGTYTVKTTNTGTIAVNPVSLEWELPSGVLVMGETSDSQLARPSPKPMLMSSVPHLGGSAIAPGETREISVVMGLHKPGPARFRVKACVNEPPGAPDVKRVAATTDFTTEVHGIPALRMELLDLADPVEKGEQTTYEIRVANTGTKADENVVVACPLPEQFQFVTASGPVGYSVQELGSCTVVKFDPIRELAPKTDAAFRVTVKAVSAGDVRFKAHLTSRHLTTSVAKEESTRVYGE